MNKLNSKQKAFLPGFLNFIKPMHLETISFWVGIGLLLAIGLLMAFGSEPYSGDIPLNAYLATFTLHHPLYSLIIFIISLIGVVLGFFGTIRNRARVQALIGLMINALLCLFSFERVFAYLILSLMGRGGIP
jgi:hypothetical protein